MNILNTLNALNNMVNLPNTTILSQLAEDLRRLIGINRNHKSGEKITLGIPTIDDYISMGFLVLDLKRTSQSTKLSSDVLENLKAIPNGVPSIVFEIQNLILENRQKLSISGVNDVLSFDDQVVMVDTELGLLTVKGENLKINKLSIDTSEVIVEGSIGHLSYSENTGEKEKTSLISRIFK